MTCIVASFPKFSLLLIYLWKQLQFVTFDPKYFKVATFSKYLFAIILSIFQSIQRIILQYVLCGCETYILEEEHIILHAFEKK